MKGEQREIMKYGQLVKECNTYLEFCKGCQHTGICQQLVSSGIARPYQYKGLPDSPILDKDTKDLLGRSKQVCEIKRKIGLARA